MIVQSYCFQGLMSTCAWMFFGFLLLASPNLHAQQNKDMSFAQQSEQMLLIDAGTKELQGDYEGALADYSKVLEKEPDNIEALIQIGFVQVKLRQLEAGAQSIQSGLKLIDDALANDPDDAKLYYLRGRVKRYMKDYAGAIEDTKKAIELDSQNESYSSALKIIQSENKFDIDKTQTVK